MSRVICVERCVAQNFFRRDQITQGLEVRPGIYASFVPAFRLPSFDSWTILVSNPDLPGKRGAVFLVTDK